MNHTTKTFFGSGAALAAVTLAGALAASPAFAVSDPADDASTYSYNEGRAAYEQRMAESHPWYDNKDGTESAAYSFRAGQSEVSAREKAFDGMPTASDVSDEELAAFFEANGIGEGSAYRDGAYDEASEESYSYNQGKASYNVYHKPYER